jgi:hypothetical protein
VRAASLVGHRARDARYVGPLGAVAWAQAVETDRKIDVVRDRVKHTNVGLETIARRQAGVRGRKNLLWISSAFPISMSRSTDLNSGLARPFRRPRARARRCWWTGQADLLLAQASAGGALNISVDTTLTLNLTDEQLDRVRREGLVVSRPIVLHWNTHQLRVVSRDIPTGATGSLVIPSDKLRPVLAR